MSLFLRVFEILMMCTLCYSYHETMRSQYRSSLAKILPYLITGFFLILISPWLSITILRILLAVLLCLSILLYRNDWRSHLFFIGSLIAGAIIVQIISTQNPAFHAEPADWLQGCLYCGVVFLIQLLLFYYRHVQYEQLYVPVFAGAAFLYLIICAYIGSQGIHVDTGIICSLQVLVILVMKLYRICFCLEIRREKELQAMVKTQHMVENRERYERIQKENAYIMMMVDAETSKADYVSPNIERLLGIPWKEVRQNAFALDKLGAPGAGQKLPGWASQRAAAGMGSRV